MAYFDITLGAGTRFPPLENEVFSFCLATPIWPPRKRSIEIFVIHLYHLPANQQGSLVPDISADCSLDTVTALQARA